MTWIIFTEAQTAQALAWNADTIYQVRPRLIDTDHALAGNYAAPERVAAGDYAEFWEGKLADHPRLQAEAADLFAPPEDMP